MKKMREINYIFYMTLLYMFSSLYIVLKKKEIYILFNIKKLIKYDSLIIIVVGLGIIFLLVNYYRNTKQVLETVIFKIILPVGVILLGLNYPNFGLDGIIYAMVVYLIVTYIFMYPIIFCKNRESNNDNTLKLYPSRKNLMDVLNHALEGYNLIALDGTWGSGKTTFMNIFMRNNSKKYYYIPINIMLFENRNSLKTEFLNQLKGIFKEEGIFQGSLIDFDYYLDGISNDWVKVVKNIIFSKSKSFKEANEKLKSEIGKIDKKIVVGVDNLERIYGESEQEWKQILGFIHELQELGIKIVVMANLGEMYGNKKDSSTEVYLNRLDYNLNLLEQEKNSDDKFKTSAEECLLCSKILAKNLKLKYEIDMNKLTKDIEDLKTKDEIINDLKIIINSIYEKFSIPNDNFINRNEYFDKFFEIRLNLQSVSTSEIIDILIETSESDFKEWLEKSEGWLKEEIQKLDVILNNHFVTRELGNKYNENGVYYRYNTVIKNPRKLKKIIDEMYTKKGLCRELYKEIEGKFKKEIDKKILFAMSLFKLYFPDYIKKYTVDGFKDGEFSSYIYNYIFSEVDRKIIDEKKLGNQIANMINKLLENLN